MKKTIKIPCSICPYVYRDGFHCLAGTNPCPTMEIEATQDPSKN